MSGVPARTRERRPTIDQAIAFLAVADANSYIGAAKHLGLPSHVPLIRLVARFADALNSEPLVVATPRGHVSLTAAGEDLLLAARAFVAAANSLAAVDRPVRFAAYPTIALRVAANAPELLAPSRRVLFTDISEATRADQGRRLVNRVANGELDVVVAPSELANDTLVEQPLYEWTMRVVLPSGHLLGGKERLRPRDLAGLGLLLAPAGHHSRELVEAAFMVDGVRFDLESTSANQYLLRQLASRSSDLAAILPDDAFGAPDAGLGPAFAAAGQAPLGGGYSLYARARDHARLEHATKVEEVMVHVAAALNVGQRAHIGNPPRDSN